MVKRGFTLLEVLLTIGIIGIITLCMMRIISGVMPDINKALFLRAYTATRAVVAEMINDRYLYPDEDTTSATYGFANTMQPQAGIYNSAEYSDSDKFPLIFADRIGAESKGDNEFYSRRDNLTYKITGSSGYYTVEYINADGDTLGSAKISNDGSVTCSSSNGYCSDMTELRKNNY